MHNTLLVGVNTMSASSGEDDWDSVNRNEWSEEAYSRLRLKTEQLGNSEKERVYDDYVETTHSSTIQMNDYSKKNKLSMVSESQIEGETDIHNVPISRTIDPISASEVLTRNDYVRNEDIQALSNGENTHACFSDNEKNDDVIHMETNHSLSIEPQYIQKELSLPQIEIGKEQQLVTEETRVVVVEEGKKEKDTFRFDDKDIQLDAADDYVGLIVHISLGFFLLLFIGIIIVCVFIASTYGFVIFAALCLLVFTVIIVGYYCVARVLLDDQTLKPVRRKMKRWQALATAVVVQEIRNFQMELREHLLLTAAEDDNYYSTNDDSSDKNHSGPTAQKHCNKSDATNGGDYQNLENLEKEKKIKTKRRKSVFFGLMKPIIPKNPRKFKIFRGRKKQQQQQNQENPLPTVSDGYVPPTANGVV
jgi:hypothetical protein